MLYIFQGPSESVTISSVNPDEDPNWERDSINLLDEHYRGRAGTYAGTRNTITNILRSAGVQFTEL